MKNENENISENENKKVTYGGYGAAKFFIICAILIWIGGIILACIAGRNAPYREKISTAFTIFITYIIYDGVSMCIGIFFERLQNIVNLLKDIDSKLPDGMTVRRKKDDE